MVALSASTHLQDGLVIHVIEDCAIDLAGFQCHPVQHWHSELGLDGLLDFDSCRGLEPAAGVQADRLEIAQRKFCVGRCLYSMVLKCVCVILQKSLSGPSVSRETHQQCDCSSVINFWLLISRNKQRPFLGNTSDTDLRVRS